MPCREDIHSILIIGAGPIIIGQACEFDYSGAQACKALKEEGFRVILVNSNPATIMTDPVMADATYIEPITPDVVARIIEKELPDVLLPTMGGQTALNTALALHEQGVLNEYNVELIGARPEAIEKAEDRKLFRAAMDSIGLESARSRTVNNFDDGMAALEHVGLPAIIRPSFTLGGEGGGVAYNSEEFEQIVRDGLRLSPVTEILIEESLLGWKEYEMEVVRAQEIIVSKCSMCHAKEPLWENMRNAPKLVNLETSTDIINNIDNIYKQSVLSYAMPPGNISFLEDNERSLINQLYVSVHNLKNK